MSGKFVDETVFSVYNEESCYWAGFLAADGCIDVNGTIRIELGGRDVEHVKLFKTFCKSEHDISYSATKNAYKIGFCSKTIKDNLLMNFSVSVDKTHNLVLPIFTEEYYYACYFRGFFDGDGCFSEFFNNRPTASYRVFLTNGSLGFLEESLDLLRSLKVVSGGSIVKKSANCWHIQFAIKDTTSFLNWIYSAKGSKLPRKYNKYYNIIVLGNRAKLCN